MGVPSRREMPGTGRAGCTTDRFWCSSPSPAVQVGRAEAARQTPLSGIARSGSPMLA
jgi:hypothetical protein